MPATPWGRNRPMSNRAMPLPRLPSAFVLIAALAASSMPAAAKSSHLRISTLSSRPEHATGGDVLVRIDVPGNAALSDVKVTLDGAEVSSAFLADASGDALV